MKGIIIFLTAICLSGTAMAQIPKVVLSDINGKKVATDTLGTHGTPVIIDFFATWCKPCNRELSAIADVYKDWQKETGVRLVAVSIDQAQNIHKVKPLVRENGWPYEKVLLDPNSNLKRALGVQMIPFVLIIDGHGKVIYKHNGYTDGAEDELIEKIRGLKKGQQTKKK